MSASTIARTSASVPDVPVGRKPPHRRHVRRAVTKSLWNVLGILVGLLMIFPVYWMVSSSFKTGVNLQRIVPQWFPAPFTTASYTRAFEQPRFLGSLLNSLIVVTGTALASLVIGFLAALALGRMNFRGRKALVVLVITIQMVPIEGLIIPMYLMLNKYGLTDSAWGLMLAYLSFVLPFTVWMLRGFIAAVPVDLEEAALVDGCTRGQAFRRIILPLAAPGLVATTVFAVIQAWNEYLFAYVLLKQNSKQTITVWLDTFITTKGVDWGALMAASTVVALPIVLLFAVIQRKVAAGITAGAVKG
ncbi:carbohydrate ABC transporter permease [Nakamurella sp. PAMC28650]|jgi:N,N'-diacetylchitobiose transport system permease protein|uniref:carbohydrate ABC transporter permease n=1 Tax=Nakamurella sp. PAMC28650 TaxID=2762325 RepID=UPI00164EAF57|nr:carbohydrate ABC transporter permease [Nakamurella sp. PAMC28650]QNK81858.1 carbohydrate ABC transporter permease [Nakamurella sp. PAMC28650]